MNRINATINITQLDNGKYHFEWKILDKPGNVVGVSKELIENGNPKLISKQDNIISLGPIKLEVIDTLEEVYICQLKFTDENTHC